MVERSASSDQPREAAAPVAPVSDSPTAPSLSESTAAWLSDARAAKSDRPLTASAVEAARTADDVSGRLTARGDARPSGSEITDATLSLLDAGNVEGAASLADNAVMLGYAQNVGVDAKIATALSQAGNDARALTLAEGHGFEPETASWAEGTPQEVVSAFAPFVDQFSARSN